MNTQLRNSIMATCLTGVLWTLSGAVIADAPSKAVNFDDLDLKQPQDVQVLYQRIRKAASMVCREILTPYGTQARDYKDCFEATVDGAVADIASPALTSLHTGTTKRIASR